MADYRHASDNSGAVIRTADNTRIPTDPRNADRQVYQVWLDEGGVTDPAEPTTPAAGRTVSRFTIVNRLQAIGRFQDLRQYLQSHPFEAEQWYSRDRVFPNDATMIALLNDLDVDPNIILAAE